MIEARELDERDFERAQVLPLHRFDDFGGRGTYLVAWDGEEPVGHVHVAWLYGALDDLTGSPVVSPNKAVAVAMVWGPETGLDAVTMSA